MAKNQSHFQLRRDTNENWLKANPVLKSGEPGFVLDTGTLKIGNGKDTFSALAEIAGGGNQGQGSGATGNSNVAVLQITGEIDPEDERKLSLSCNIAQTELKKIQDEKKVILCNMTVDTGEYVMSIPGIGTIAPGEDNNPSGVGFYLAAGDGGLFITAEMGYENENYNILTGTVTVEEEDSKSPIYSFLLALDGNYVYFNPVKVDEIKDALRANKIVIATMSDQDLFAQYQICAYEIKNGNTSFYCTDGSSFTYNEEANRYNLNKS